MPTTMEEIQAINAPPPACPTCGKPMARSCFHSDPMIGWEDCGSWHCASPDCHHIINDTNHETAMARFRDAMSPLRRKA